jgi:XTP/dITP diphosphohydrolase
VPATGFEQVVSGRWPGRLAREAAGAGGFGYDPVFVPEGLEVSAAELSAAEKNAISHRARAFEAAIPVLRMNVIPD